MEDRYAPGILDTENSLGVASIGGADVESPLPDAVGVVHMPIPSLLTWAIFLTLLASSARPAVVGQCDPAVLSYAEQGPNKYEQRGDRCEGIYLRPVSGEGSFLIASLTFGKMRNDVPTAPMILLQWKPETADIHLRAYSLRPRVYYQMDSVRSGGDGIYRWPSDVIAAVGLGPQDLGLVAWSFHAFGTRQKQVFIPLNAGNSAGAPRHDVEMVIQSGRDLREVYITIARLNGDGTVSATLRRAEPLRYGVYAAEGGIDIVLPELRTSGLYALAISGEVREGGTIAAQILVSV